MKLDRWDPRNFMPSGRAYEVYHESHPIWNTLTFHSHPFWEIYLFVSGSVEIQLEEFVYQMQPGDLILFPPGLMHKNVPLGSNEHYDRWYAYIREPYLRDISSEACNFLTELNHVADNRSYHLHLDDRIQRAILEAMDQVIQLRMQEDVFSRVMEECQMKILLATLCQHFQDALPAAPQIIPDRVRQLMQYLNQHFTEPLSLDQLSETFYTSKYHLLREFRAYTGATIHQYLTTKRIVYAQLLLQRGCSLQESALQAGFPEYSTFFRSFRAATGVSPQEFVRTRL